MKAFAVKPVNQPADQDQRKQHNKHRLSVDTHATPPLWSRLASGRQGRVFIPGQAMKIRNSIRSLKARDKDCRVVRRRGRVYIINKVKRRYKARQG